MRLRNQPQQVEEHQPGAHVWFIGQVWIRKQATSFLRHVSFIELCCQGHPVQTRDAWLQLKCFALRPREQFVFPCIIT
ncbi:hypothetical protein D187_008418 [Cystobacter fuscus DSM 2262]|uniref:Uncharacterized protein n=1 Tax=Cystobacter fuscus (strain ATCC 25194 / DSM 2262 / NBRC 100088 / M29) TaxID=1242864 RepID=S9PGN2_CYSF2|nr:hypothetical protein D187_008418 [Cystobacter fuscus DSM 2262]